MKPQELSSIRTLLKTLANYDEYIHNTFSEAVYEDLTEKMELAAGLDAALSIISLHYVGLSWGDFYDKVDVKESYSRHGFFIPDKLFGLLTYDNSNIDKKQVFLLFKQAKPLISKGIKNDKTRKTRTKRAK